MTLRTILLAGCAFAFVTTANAAGLDKPNPIQKITPGLPIGGPAKIIGPAALGIAIKNRKDIKKHDAEIKKNRKDIDKNSANIKKNEKDIDKNTDDIYENTQNIADNRKDININKNNIKINSKRISANEADIADLDGRVTTNENNITDLQRDLGDLGDLDAANFVGAVGIEEKLTVTKAVNHNADRINQAFVDIGQNTAAIDDNRKRIVQLEEDVDELQDGVAMAVAMANAPTVRGDADDKFSLSGGFGYYEGSAAGALRATYMPRNNIAITTSIATDMEDGFAAGGGIGFSF